MVTLVKTLLHRQKKIVKLSNETFVLDMAIMRVAKTGDKPSLRCVFVVKRVIKSNMKLINKSI